MRLGGFVIHGNSADTLGDALSDLCALCDDVVAVDSGSNDGSAEIAAKSGARTLQAPWQGYGYARRVAAEALAVAGCDYILFLDSDERFAPGSLEVLRAWRQSEPTSDIYRLPRHDWVEVEGRRFRYRTESRRRIFRTALARWDAAMIVHESVPGPRGVQLPAAVDHRFATDLSFRAAKNDRYALLWALQAAAEGRSVKPPGPQRVAHFVKDSFLKGALFRGGLVGARVAWQVSRYHARKYELLRAVQQGHFDALLALYRSGQYRELFLKVADQLPAGPTAPESTNGSTVSTSSGENKMS